MGERAAQNHCGIEAERKVVMKPTRAKVAFITQWSHWLGPRICMKTKSSNCVHVVQLVNQVIDEIVHTIAVIV